MGSNLVTKDLLKAGDYAGIAAKVRATLELIQQDSGRKVGNGTGHQTAREQCRWDAAALGEVMLRLDPGEGRIRTARSFQVWEGGGEYNVARGLRRCFGLRTTVVTRDRGQRRRPSAGRPDAAGRRGSLAR